MDSATRKQLEELAQQRIKAIADDDEQWSFLFHTEGSVDLPYCSLSSIESWTFDGSTEGLELLWSADRIAAISSGASDLSEEEMDQWRRAQARRVIADLEDSDAALIVPLQIEGETEGYALFVVEGLPEEPPILEGVFDSVEEAKAALRVKGEFEEH